jgi:hypothetical protein
MPVFAKAHGRSVTELSHDASSWKKKIKKSWEDQARMLSVNGRFTVDVNGKFTPQQNSALIIAPSADGMEREV